MFRRYIIPIIFICFVAFGFKPDTSAVTPARPESGNASGTSQPWIPDQVRDDERGEIGFTNKSGASDSGQAGMTRFERRNNALTNDKNPNSPIPQSPNYLITQFPNSPIPQYPDNLFYSPWLEYPSRRVEFHPDSLPPNQGTDDYQIIWHTTGESDGSQLGGCMVSAGDQNMDGYDDILAACWDPEENRLYHGGCPMDTIPDMIFPSQAVHTSWWGNLPDVIGDLNSDGHLDFTISADMNYAEARVFVYFGGDILDNQPDLIMVNSPEGPQSETGFGYYTSFGDINGDGNDDLAIGAPGYRVNSMNGKIYIHLGGPDLDSIPDFTITSGYNNFGDVFGGYLSIAGDINNDGYDDMLCSSYLNGDGGCLLFFSGEVLDSIPDWIYTEGTTHVAIIKDLNSDGCDEIAVLDGYGGYYWTIDLFWGGDSPGSVPDLVLSGPQNGATRMASAGDVNADGYNDMIAGDYGTGKVMVYFGGEDMSSVPSLTYYGWYAGAEIGAAGDVNGDVIHDFMFFTAVPGSQLNGQIWIYSDPSLTPHVEPRYSKNRPLSFSLEQNFPNPFNSATVIPFHVHFAGEYELKIYNILGQAVFAQIFECSSGENVRVRWDGIDLNGNSLPSGIYLVELTNGVERETMKMQILR